MSKEKQTTKISFAEYKQGFLNDFSELASALGIEPGEAQTYSAPPVYPFVVGVLPEDYLKRRTINDGNYVTKVIFGSADPNKAPVPSNKNIGDGPRVAYHVYQNGSTHWSYPYEDASGKKAYFFASIDSDKIVEYLSKSPNVKLLVESNLKLKRNKRKAEFTEQMSALKKGKMVFDPIVSAIWDLFSESGLPLKDMRYRTQYAKNEVFEDEIQIGVGGSFVDPEGRSLVFVPRHWNSKKEVKDTGWFVVDSNKNKSKVTLSEVKEFLVSIKK